MRARHASRRQDVGLRELGIQVQQDGHDLGDDLAIVDQHWHLAARIQCQVVGGALLSLVQLDHGGFKFHARNFQHGVGHERTGAGGEMELQAHGWVSSIQVGASITEAGFRRRATRR
jgi:hypothetical protein